MSGSFNDISYSAIRAKKKNNIDTKLSLSTNYLEASSSLSSKLVNEIKQMQNFENIFDMTSKDTSGQKSDLQYDDLNLESMKKRIFKTPLLPRKESKLLTSKPLTVKKESLKSGNELALPKKLLPSNKSSLRTLS